MVIKKINVMEKLTYYSNILEKLHFANENKKKEYLDFCLNEVKENIILCHNNEHPTKIVIKELFKRAIAKKRQIDSKN